MVEFNGISETTQNVVEKVKWEDLIYKGGNFISLDISKTNTGWVKCFNGKLEMGAISFKTYEDVEARYRFKQFVKELIGDGEYAFISIEDVIGGTNFRTNKILYQLNIIVDDLMYEGYIKPCKIERIDNMQWKKTLREITGEKANIKQMESKEEVRYQLKHMGCDIELEQDILDALGMSIAVIHRRMNGQATGKVAKLKTDLSKSYKLKEFNDEQEAQIWIDKLKKKVGYESKEVITITYEKRFKDINGCFKKQITEQGRDSDIYILKAPVGKLGLINLKKGIGNSKGLEEIAIFTAYLAVKKG